MTETTDVAVLLGTGAGAAALFQALKGDNWNVWLIRVLAIALGFGGGFFAQDGLNDGVVTATATLATHSVAFADTRLGKALELHLLPRGLNLLSELAANISKATENKS